MENGRTNVEPSDYFSINRTLCLEDCESTIGTICSIQHWNLLTIVINELKRIGGIQLPNLQQKSDCNSSLATSTNCISVIASKNINFVFYSIATHITTCILLSLLVYMHKLYTILYMQGYPPLKVVYHPCYPQQT